MAETRVEGDGIRRRATVRRDIVTGRARADVTPARVCLAVRVALVTGVVRLDAGRNRDGDAAPQCGCVTGGAAHRGLRFAPVVLRVVELGVEAFVELGRERLKRRIASRQTRMTDIAHRNVGRDELREVAIGASLVAGEARRRVVVRARVARSAGQTRMVAGAVRES